MTKPFGKAVAQPGRRVRGVEEGGGVGGFNGFGFNGAAGGAGSNSLRAFGNSTDTLESFSINGTLERPFVFGDTYDLRTRAAGSDQHHPAAAAVDDGSLEGLDATSFRSRAWSDVSSSGATLDPLHSASASAHRAAAAAASRTSTSWIVVLPSMPPTAMS